MKTIHLHFRKTDRWLWLIVWSLLLLTGQVRGQIYSSQFSGTGFEYFDLTTQTWTAKASPPEAISGTTTYQGKIYALASQTNKLYLYDPGTNTWTAKAPAVTTSPTSLTNGRLATAGNYIYAGSAAVGVPNFARYDPATDTWTRMADFTLYSGSGTLAYDGGDYLYFGSSAVAALARYSISNNSWTNMATPTALTRGSVYKNGKLYFTDAFGYLYSFDPTTSTYAVASAAKSGYLTTSGNDNKLYLLGNPSTSIYSFDLSTNTWTTYTGPASGGYLLYFGATCSPTASATTTQATCATNGGVNANATLTLSAYGGGVTKVGYSAGSSYAGPDFSTATAVTAAPMTLANNLANPTVPQPYTIRAFQDATCYKDIIVTLLPKLCITGNGSLSISPAQLSGNKGETVSFTVTLTNSGPDAVPNAQVRVPIPANTTLLSASPQQGTYSSATQKWDVGTMPVGSKTMLVTLKMN